MVEELAFFSNLFCWFEQKLHILHAFLDLAGVGNIFVLRVKNKVDTGLFFVGLPSRKCTEHK